MFDQLELLLSRLENFHCCISSSFYFPGNIFLTDVSHIVIDEVDTMWGDDFRPTVLHILSLLKASRNCTKYHFFFTLIAV